ncbi:MAG: plasmid pRiA4b ORF-3 family protein [Pseudonocardiaceae bacterium]|nr:plasmid pRiA4b ORF-3 family protein [Pseudonocardiaceae bacterium]
MSPVSRGRKRKKDKKTVLRGPELELFPVPAEECDCPACSGDFDSRQLVDELTAGAAELLDTEDPLDAEMTGALFMSIGEFTEGFEDALVGGLIPEFEAGASAESLAMLLAIGSVADGQPGAAASAAAERLRAAGLPSPGWAAELTEPVTVADRTRLTDPDGVGSILTCTFHRAGRSHAMAISVDHLDCDAATNIHLLGADELPAAREMMRAEARAAGVEIVEDTPGPADFRWYVETALNARADHDREGGADRPEPPVDEEDVPDYHAMAVLLRAWIRALPAPSEPPADMHGAHEAELDGFAFGTALPAKRAEADGPAPGYRIKVTLRGAKPPIWRRLEVPADISLARLHTVIQIAFGWEDCHLHAFRTPYGDFGIDDAELGYRAEEPVSLEQVAPGEKSKIRYTYDFGDSWDHEIQVEKVLDREDAENHPRCTGGRRAAPPEDCGGIASYAYLVEILADPSHPEHEERLDWLGLDAASKFDPVAFDTGAINQALARLR